MSMRRSKPDMSLVHAPGTCSGPAVGLGSFGSWSANSNFNQLGLAKHKATKTGVASEEYNPVLLKPEKAAQAVDTPRDGACLFHALYASYREATLWLPNNGLIGSGADMRLIESTADMRTRICDYIEDNPDKLLPHSDTIRAKAALELKRPMAAVTYEGALPVYCQMMRRQAEWGGDPELDAAAMMLNVIVHEFAVHVRGGERNTAVLHATFYPTQSQLDNKAERKQLTKFVLIWRDNHFEYVRPDVPKTLQDAVSTPSSSAQAAVTVRERDQHIKNMRTKHDASKTSSRKNNMLKAMAEARESRMQQQNGNGKCALEAAKLTQEQQEEMATMQLIRNMQLQDKDYNADAALARKMQREEEASALKR